MANQGSFQQNIHKFIAGIVEYWNKTDKKIWG